MPTDPTDAERRYLAALAREMRRPVGVMTLTLRARARTTCPVCRLKGCDGRREPALCPDVREVARD